MTRLLCRVYLECWLSALDLNAATRVVEREIVPSGKPVAKEDVICVDDPRSVNVQRRRTVPPFVLSHDAARGAFCSLQALLTYTLMLAVM